MTDDIFTCIPISLNIKDIFIEVTRLTDDKADKQSAVLSNVIHAVAECVKQQLDVDGEIAYREAFPYQKLRHTPFEGSGSDQVVISADMEMAMMTIDYDASNSSISFERTEHIHPIEIFRFKAYGPHGLRLTNSQSKLAAKLIFLKEAFYVGPYSNDEDSARLLRHMNAHHVISKISRAFNAQSLAEIVVQLGLNGINIAT